METRFRDWLSCPTCDGGKPSVLAHGETIVLECYDCTLVAEFELGEDLPFHDLGPKSADER